MAKAQVIDALMISAIRCFGRQGFEGASLRDIAADANAPLSSIHTYFGSKQALYEEICRKAWAEMSEERSALILRAAANSPDGIAPLPEIVRALAYPVVRRTLGGNEIERDIVRIIREAVAYQVINRLGRHREEPRIFWLQSIQRACPDFSWPAVVWVYSFMIGAIYSWQITDRLYEDLRELDVSGAVKKSGNTVETVTKGLVEFCTAGIEALHSRQDAPDAGRDSTLQFSANGPSSAGRLPPAGLRPRRLGAPVPELLKNGQTSAA